MFVHLMKSSVPSPFWIQSRLLLKWLGRCQNPVDTMTLWASMQTSPSNHGIPRVKGVNARISMETMPIGWSFCSKTLKSIPYSLHGLPLSTPGYHILNKLKLILVQPSIQISDGRFSSSFTFLPFSPCQKKSNKRKQRSTHSFSPCLASV